MNQSNKVKQILRDIKLAELLGYKLKGDAKRVKTHIDKSLNNLSTLRVDKYPNSIFFKRSNIIMFELDLESDSLYCNHEYYWKVFNNSALDYWEIIALTSKLVCRNLDCEEFSVSNNDNRIIELMNG